MTRELFTVTHVDEWETQGGQILHLIRGHVVDNPLEQRTLRTLNGWRATLCQMAIGKEPLWVEWRENPFRRSWLEFDLIEVERS